MLDFIKAWNQMCETKHPPFLGLNKCHFLYNQLSTTLDRTNEGDIAEIGVYRGETSAFMKILCPDKTLHCYDTFCGILGADSAIDVHKNGEFCYGLEDVKKTVGTDNVLYHVGMFPDSFAETDRSFCFVHSDTDTYLGTKATLDVMWPLLQTGGCIVFDDEAIMMDIK